MALSIVGGILWYAIGLYSTVRFITETDDVDTELLTVALCLSLIGPIATMTFTLVRWVEQGKIWFKKRKP